MWRKVLYLILYFQCIAGDETREKCINFFVKDTIINNRTNDFHHICDSLHSGRRNDMLFVLTTCNHLKYTIQALETLRRSTDVFDLIIVDDYSVDGSVEYLTKMGYAVISKSSPHGLTHSWNVAYRLAQLLRYKYVIFANNDILIPSGAVDALRRDLIAEALVVPLTTLKGAGHNPSQDVGAVYPLDHNYLQWYINVPHHFQRVQDALMLQTDTNTSLHVSQYKNMLRFNGFLFAVNMQLISPAAFDGQHLFDPSNINVEQENTLMRSMEAQQILPKISKRAFIYHFKSVTVKPASKMNRVNHEENRNNLTLFHKQSTAPLHYPALYAKYPEIIPSYLPPVYPIIDGITIGIVIEAGVTLSNHQAKVTTLLITTQLITKQMISHSLDSMQSAELMQCQNNWYDLQDVDVLLNLHPTYNVTKIERAKPTLLLVGWMVDRFTSWVSLPWLGRYDVLLTSSHHQIKDISLRQFSTRCTHYCPSPFFALSQPTAVQAKLLLLATDAPSQSSAAKHLDFVCIGPAHLSSLMDKPSLKDCKGRFILQSDMSQLPLHAVIEAVRACRVLVVHVESFAAYWGEYDALMLEAAAAGTLVLTNDMYFGSNYSLSTLSHRDISEIPRCLKDALLNSAALAAMTTKNQLQMKTHSFRNRAIDLRNILQEYIFLAPKRGNTTTDGVRELSPGICIGLAMSTDTMSRIYSSLKNIYSAPSSFNVYTTLINTQRTLAREYVSSIHLLLQQYNTNSVRLRWIHDEHDMDYSGRRRSRPNTTDISTSNKQQFFMLDAMDTLLDHFMQLGYCEWIVILEPTIAMPEKWISSISRYVADASVDVVRWNNAADQCSTISNVMVRRKIYEKRQHRLLKHSVLRPSSTNRTYEVVMGILDEIPFEYVKEVKI